MRPSEMGERRGKGTLLYSRRPPPQAVLSGLTLKKQGGSKRGKCRRAYVLVWSNPLAPD